MGGDHNSCLKCTQKLKIQKNTTKYINIQKNTNAHWGYLIILHFKFHNNIHSGCSRSATNCDTYTFILCRKGDLGYFDMQMAKLGNDLEITSNCIDAYFTS